MGDDRTEGAPLRRDARRNRELLIAAAREVYAEQGVEAPLDEIARRAGVGNATLYRRFPTRASLVEAVFRDSLAETLRVGEEARRSGDAWSGLTGYLEHIFAGLAADRGANDLMTTAVEGVPSLEALKAHHHETVSLLIGRARDQGTVRGDVTTEDLLFSLAALGRVVPASVTVAPDAWRRHLALLLDGLRAGAAGGPLPAPPLTPAQLGGVLHALGPSTAGR
ncbi:TetR/AcrR family transcriptional regulator [Streptomyces sp. HB2AG]|uniref:TetR/AcrR family transcriptional regulator n=1 Tax=Streptomyces sp. HB2AG TaxID=2983400 RepID=UPI0022AAB028|nr:helix-turn-helix domain-containing protein [Streptomyces sp. HB2AG]MCZ2527757.1 helix-turn-helix domain containing protein [Streptomyces sp. HB2AG]